MAKAQAKAHNDTALQGRILLLLLFCHCLIAGVAILSRNTLLPILGASLLSLLLLLPLPYNLHVLETSLQRLTHGLSLEPLALRWYWPLKRLFALVNQLGQQTNQQVQVEQRNAAYRDQLLQQVSKTATQEERNRLARDLHDSIKQQIFSIVVSAAAIKARWETNPASVRKVVDDIERTALEAQVEMNALLQQLRPTALENVGLLEALRVQCQALGYRTGAEVTAELDDLPPAELLPIGAQEMLFRIVQEGFANIARHARASHVWLSLKRQEDTLLVEIGDDGQGFDLAKAHESLNAYSGMGLSNVRERVDALGGSINVWSLPNHGTTLHACIPLAAPQAHKQELTDQKVTTAAHRAHLALCRGLWSIELAAAFILLYTPSPIAPWATGICIMTSIVTLLWAQQYRLQIAMDGGRTHPHYTRLLAQSYGLFAGIVFLCMLYPNYFAASRSFVLGQDLNLEWVMPVFFGTFILIMLVSYIRSLQNDERYCGTLAYRELRELVQRRTQQIIIDWLAWVCGIGLAVLQFHLFPDLFQDYTTLAMGSVMLFAWFLSTLVKTIHCARWHSVLSHVQTVKEEM